MLNYMDNYHNMELEKRNLDQNEYIYTYRNSFEMIEFRFIFEGSLNIVHFIVYPRGKGLGTSFIGYLIDGLPSQTNIKLKPKNSLAVKFWLSRGFRFESDEVMVYNKD
ncbi:hypothetical protein [Desulfosporosinus sp. SB140]|uniref:hypothetical protein n=1 Tax=Desulfosporosinus paludis TaxID=3115649 RepID=UPI00388D7821